MGAGRIVPDTYASVPGASDDQLFPDANVEAGNLILVERSTHIPEPRIIVLLPVVFEINVSGDELARTCGNVDLVLMLVCGHCGNHVFGVVK